MKKFLLMALAFCLFCAPVWAENTTEETASSLKPDEYHFANFIEGGINFLVPDDFTTFPLYETEKAAGYLFFGGNEHFTMSMRRYTPEEMTLPEFTLILINDSGTEVTLQENNGAPVVIYYNLNPQPNLQLCGAALVGLDGMMYKISIFTGDHNDISEEAPVWEISQIILNSVCLVDFSSTPFADIAE